MAEDQIKLKASLVALQRDKDNSEGRLKKEIENWRMRTEELADYSEEQLTKYGERDS